MGLFERVFGRLVDRRIAAYQSDLLERQYREVEQIYRTMRGWRHDYHNHIQAIRALAAEARASGDPACLKKLEDYLSALNSELCEVDTVLKTGNVMVDAILNSKLSLLRSKGIEINAKATVPRELKLSEVEFFAVMGNLLDNAMEACLRQPEGERRFVRLYIGALKGQLYLSVSNSSGGEVRRSGRTYLSTKGEPSHGFGLVRIDRIVEKYGGYVNRQNEEGVFATEVLLPL